MAEKKRISVLRSIYIMTIALLSSFAIGLGVYVYLNIKRDKIKELNHTLEIIKSYYELSFRQWELSLFSVGQRLIEIQGENELIERYEYAISALSIYDQLLAFGLVDTTGQVITFTGAYPGDSLPNLMMNPKARRSFLQAKNQAGLSIGEAYFFQNVGDYILPVRVPLFNEQNKLIAINTSAIRYQSLFEELDRFKINPNIVLQLNNKTFESVQLYYPSSPQQFDAIIQQPSKILDLNQLANDAWIEMQNVFDNNQKHLAVVADMSRFDHQLIVSIRKSVIMGEVLSALITVGSVYFTLVFITTFVFLYYRKKQQEYLQQLETEKANLKSIFQNTTSIIGLFDKQMKLAEYNPSFVEYSKFTDDIDLYPGIDILSQMKNQQIADLFKVYIGRALKGEKFSELLDYPFNEGSFSLLFNYNPVIKDNEIIGVTLFVEDVTTLRQAQIELQRYNENLEELVKERTTEIENQKVQLESTLIELKATQSKLVQSEKMASLGILSAGIGHEINNPLNFIRHGVYNLHTELINQYPESAAISKPFIEIIEEGVTRASNIVKSLSHFSRQGANMKESCDINAIIKNCMVILTNKLKNKIDLGLELLDTLPIIQGNEGKLHQAFLNIITNAEQSIVNPPGSITIKTEVTTNYIKVIITDNGCGIPPEHLHRISDPFFTTKPPGAGTGLGLFITYSIITEHKGEINVTSETNKGTSFEVLLPIN